MGRNLEVAGTYGAHVVSFNETFCISITDRNYNSIAPCSSYSIFLFCSRAAQLAVRTDSVIVNSKHFAVLIKDFYAEKVQRTFLVVFSLSTSISSKRASCAANNRNRSDGQDRRVFGSWRDQERSTSCLARHPGQARQSEMNAKYLYF